MAASGRLVFSLDQHLQSVLHPGIALDICIGEGIEAAHSWNIGYSAEGKDQPCAE